MAESENIKELNVKRGTIKRTLTFTETTLAQITATSDLTALDLEERLEKHKALWSEFDSIQTRLDLLVTDPTEVPKQIEERTSFENRYFTISGRIKKILTENPRLRFTTASSSSVSSLVDQPFTASRNSEANNYKLPFLNLPKFSGNYETWLGFSDTFKALVDSNSKIQDVEKLVHLKSCLDKDAAEVISSIETSSENYKVAWELLQDRYDNKKVIIESHAKSILDLQPVSKENSIRAFLDQLQKHLRALRALGESVDSWDTLLLLIIKHKLTYQLRERWEDLTSESTSPKMKQFLEFLQRRAQFDEIKGAQVPLNSEVKSESRYENRRGQQNIKRSQPQHAYLANSNKLRCYYCQADHSIYACGSFLKLSFKERSEFVKKASLCLNCLHPNHQLSDCRGGSCRKCGKRHNSLLHIDSKPETSDGVNATFPTHNMHVRTELHTFLSTALVDICDNQGRPHTCRVMLDNGSQSNFLSEKMARLLKLVIKPVEIPVKGLGSMSTGITSSATALIKSRFNRFQKKLDFLLVSNVANQLPSIYVDRRSLNIPSNLTLADPEFYIPSEVDALLGVKLFYQLLCKGQRQIKGHEAVLQKTQLGWIIAGEIGQDPARLQQTTCRFLQTSTRLDRVTCNSLQTANRSESDELTRFWDIEQVPIKKHLSKEEQICERHFTENVKRDSTGRYTVKLPFRENKSMIGDSHKIALRRFHALEGRLAKSPTIKASYTQFMEEYIQLDHMSEVQDSDRLDRGFFLPHHAVIKGDSLTTKTRVVFDGSVKTSSGISLNDTLMVGPTIQDNLFSIYSRFRSFPYAFTADIEKMYRQINISSEDLMYQKILWRKNPNEPLKSYNLKTVTYGTASAPFLAIRVLAQLSQDEYHSHPMAATVLARDFYVDDLASGAATFDEAAALRDELIQLVQKGGFTLRKWASNDPRLTRDLLERSENDFMSLHSSETIKTLGLYWNSAEDKIIYKITENAENSENSRSPLTKRKVLAKIARLFDPLGLLGPTVVYAKMIIQVLWKLQLMWDEPIPQEAQSLWLEFKEQLPLLNTIKFDRCIVALNAVEIQLHGFADASEKGYGACIYLRSTDEHGKHHVVLVGSKSRVAPIQTVTLPRLELCAAGLLSQFFAAVVQSLQHLNIRRAIFWSDSTISLHWIKTSPHLLKTFVSNRVAQIQELTQPHEWKHVPTEENPADFASRGQLPRDFVTNNLWKQGPDWLSQDEGTWPQMPIKPVDIPEMRNVQFPQMSMKVTLEEADFFQGFNSFNRLTRVIAYCRRFRHNANPNNPFKFNGPLSEAELKMARDCIIKRAQGTAFATEIRCLSSNHNVDKGSKLVHLNPFLDEGILKVGGRLTHSDLSYDEKHPILLPRNHSITRMIIVDAHLMLKHAGTQATLYTVRGRYWPIDGRNTVRRIIFNCVTCFKAKPRGATYQMGNLPANRLEYSRPFLNVGVDFCGPLYIKERRYRNVKKIKSYVAVFICLATKAVHLELVSDLSSITFIGCLKRFISRRGNVETISSDNGKNFVGASRELRDLYDTALSGTQSHVLRNYLQRQGIRWNFIPPLSPHFGGLWEAAVKSFKYHLVRTVGHAVLTYEQLETCVVEIEAILNSRPISPMSSDPNDLRPLTPGHFLIGGPLMSFPQENLQGVKTARLSLWQHAQQMRQHFWCRWHKEYINELNVRSKWTSTSPSIKVGTLAILKDSNLTDTSPMLWNMCRVIETHPGPDGVVRVVTVKTTNGIYKRCVRKLCPLPTEVPDPDGM